MSPPVCAANVFSTVWNLSATGTPTPIEYTAASDCCAILTVSSRLYLLPRESTPSETRKIILRLSCDRVRNNCAAAYTASLMLLMPFPPHNCTEGFAGKPGPPGGPICG